MSNPLVSHRATWLYPLQGIYYFLTHRFLWPLFRRRLFSVIVLSAFIYTPLFLFAYLPQVAFLAIFQGSTAWVNGLFLVLEEGAVLVAMLFEAFFVDEALVDIFDAVLINEGQENLVAKSRVLHPDEGSPVKRLGKPTSSVVYSPFSIRQIVEFIILLPLNLVPVAGAPIFLVLIGLRAGPFHHWRYFALLELSKQERTQYVQKRSLKYTAFGTVAVILQLVPVLSMFFLLTTATGSALWAAGIEQRKSLEQTSQRVEEEYQDDPV